MGGDTVMMPCVFAQIKQKEMTNKGQTEWIKSNLTWKGPQATGNAEVFYLGTLRRHK